MAVDIGPRIGVDGEAQFRAQLQNINQQLKTLGSEMQAVTSEFIGNEKSQEALTAQSRVLNRQIEAQEQKLSELKKGLEMASREYGENDTKTLKWAQAVQDATRDLNRMQAQLGQTKNALQDVGNEINDLGADLDGAANKASGFGDVMKGSLAATAITSGVSFLAEAVGNLASQFINLDEATAEYRIAQGRVDTAFEAAGYSAEAGARAYEDFYKILGESDTAAEASQLLARLTEAEQDLTKWTRIAAGVAGTFGQALPIESLIEAANETAKVGTVTGTLADALNWVGVSEDEFNEKLAAAGSEAERNRLIMETLSGTYDEAADAFYRNNEALVAMRENEAAVSEMMSGLGETVSQIKNTILAEFLPALSGVSSAFNDLLQGGAGADATFSDAIGGLIETAINALPKFINTGLQIVQSLIMGILDNIPLLGATALELVVNLAGKILESLPELVASGAEMLAALAQGIGEQLPELVQTAVLAVTDWLNRMTEELPRIMQSGTEIITALVGGILDSLPVLLATLPELISAFVGYLSNYYPELLQMGLMIILAIAQGLIENIPEIIKVVPDILRALFVAVVEAADQLLEIGQTIVAKIKDGIAEAWEGLTSWFSGLWDGLFGDRSANVTVNRRVNDIDGSHAAGLDYVPYDGYLAELHRGEMVLDEATSNLLRGLNSQMHSGTNQDGPALGRMAAGMVNGIQTALSGLSMAQPATIVLQMGDGREMARWILSDLRAVMKANPEVS